MSVAGSPTGQALISRGAPALHACAIARGADQRRGLVDILPRRAHDVTIIILALPVAHVHEGWHAPLADVGLVAAQLAPILAAYAYVGTAMDNQVGHAGGAAGGTLAID